MVSLVYHTCIPVRSEDEIEERTKSELSERRRLDGMKAELTQLLTMGGANSVKFRGKYPTVTGKLQIPKTVSSKKGKAGIESETDIISCCDANNIPEMQLCTGIPGVSQFRSLTQLVAMGGANSEDNNTKMLTWQAAALREVRLEWRLKQIMAK